MVERGEPHSPNDDDEQTHSSAHVWRSLIFICSPTCTNPTRRQPLCTLPFLSVAGLHESHPAHCTSHIHNPPVSKCPDSRTCVLISTLFIIDIRKRRIADVYAPFYSPVQTGHLQHLLPTKLCLRRYHLYCRLLLLHGLRPRHHCFLGLPQPRSESFGFFTTRVFAGEEESAWASPGCRIGLFVMCSS